MGRIYVIYGILICGLMAYADSTGWSVWDSASSGHWTPNGPNVHGGGRSFHSGGGGSYGSFHK